MGQIYDTLGRTYSATRRADPRIARHIWDALDGAPSVANIGAGAGSYEPAETVVAVEPSQVMIDQRPPGSAPVIRAAAERLPLRTGCVDAAMASLTVHHWTDLERGLAEMQRVARGRLVFFTWRAEITERYWLLNEYFPEAAAVDREHAVSVEVLTDLLGGATVEPVPIPHDCTDGFGAAYWRRPEAYLDPGVRAGMSFLARLDERVLQPGLDQLAADLASGRWPAEHAELLDRAELDVGYCVVVSDSRSAR